MFPDLHPAVSFAMGTGSAWSCCAWGELYCTLQYNALPISQTAEGRRWRTGDWGSPHLGRALYSTERFWLVLGFSRGLFGFFTCVWLETQTESGLCAIVSNLLPLWNLLYLHCWADCVSQQFQSRLRVATVSDISIYTYNAESMVERIGILIVSVLRTHDGKCEKY